MYGVNISACNALEHLCVSSMSISGSAHVLDANKAMIPNSTRTSHNDKGFDRYVMCELHTSFGMHEASSIDHSHQPISTLHALSRFVTLVDGD